jgi:DNA-binding NtrC family response regulator
MRKNILLVEPDAEHRVMLTRMLEQIGDRDAVIPLETPEEGLKALQSAGFDLAVIYHTNDLDCRLTGVELGLMIAEKWPKVSVIIIHDGDAGPFHESVSANLVKPFGVGQLATAIEHALSVQAGS